MYCIKISLFGELSYCIFREMDGGEPQEVREKVFIVFAFFPTPTLVTSLRKKLHTQSAVIKFISLQFGTCFLTYFSIDFFWYHNECS